MSPRRAASIVTENHSPRSGDAGLVPSKMIEYAEIWDRYRMIPPSTWGAQLIIITVCFAATVIVQKARDVR